MSKSRSIRLFLASSMTLEEREAFPALILEFNKLHDVQVEPVLCDYDAPSGDYEGARFQDRFNKLLDGCEIALVLFYAKAGDFTVEEMERARKVCKKTFVYFRKGFAPVNEEEHAALGTVFTLKGNIGKGKDLVYQEYTTLAEFRDQFKKDLWLFLKEEYAQEAPDENRSATLPYRLFSWTLWENTFFTGRVAERRRMDEVLAEPGSFLALTGAGGFGKTSLATQYFKSHADRHSHVHKPNLRRTPTIRTIHPGPSIPPPRTLGPSRAHITRIPGSVRAF